MSTPAATLAPGFRDIVPSVIPFDMSADPLEAFSSERSAVPAPSRAPVPAPARAADVRLAPEPLAADAPVTGRTPLAAGSPVTRDEVRRAPAPARGVRIRVPKWMGTGSVAILAGALGGLTIAFLFQGRIAASVAGTATPIPSGGPVTITTDPPGVPVRVDGIARGVTPFATMLATGPHRVEVGEGSQSRVRELHVRPGLETVVHVELALPVGPGPASAAHASLTPDALDLRPPGVRPDPRAPGSSAAPGTTVRSTSSRSLPSAPRPAPAPTGYLTVASPLPVRVLADGQDVGVSGSGRLTVPAGTRVVTLVNERFEFSESREIHVAASRTQSIAIDMPRGTLHVNARPWADVWIDGRRAGDTPIGNLALPVGEHEVVLRHPQLGEERRTVTVGARTPVRVSVEFTR